MSDPISRRAYLGQIGTAVSVTGLTASGLLDAAAQAQTPPAPASPNERLTTALIGCGGMGRGDMNNAIGHGMHVVAVCDVDSRNMAAAAMDVEKRQGKAPEQIKDFRKLLERKDIDTVIIATPDHWHALPFIYACEAGKDIYCEKPISHSIAEAKAMAAAAKHHGRVVQVGTWQRSTKEFVDAIHYVRSGRLGKVTTVKAWKTDWFSMGKNPAVTPPSELDWEMWIGPAKMVPYTAKNGHFNWRWYWNTGCGNTGDWGVHMMDIGLLAMSPDTHLVMPQEVGSFGGKLSSGEEDDRTTPDTQLAIFKFPNFVMHWQTGRRGLEYGYGRQAPAGDGGPQRPPQDILDNGTAFIAADGSSLVVWRGGWTVRDAQGNEKPKVFADLPHHDHMRDWIECIKSRQQPRSNIASMAQTTITCHLANLAHLTGEVIRWDAEKMDVIGNTGKDETPYAREYRKPWKLPVYK